MPVFRQSGAAASGLQRSAQVGLGDFERRDRGERQARQQRGRAARRRARTSRADFAAAWKVGGAQARENLRSSHRDQQADDSAPGGRDQALRHELADDAEAAGAEGRADRDLSAPRRAPRQHQRREIGARDEEQRAGGRKEQEQRRSSASDDVLVQGRDGHVHPALESGWLCSSARARAWISPLAVASWTPGFRRAMTDSARLPRCAIAIRLEHERHPHVGGGELESGRDDADDRVGLAVETQGGADGAAVGAEAPPPEFLADHHAVVVPGAVLIRQERTALKRVDAEERKQVRGDAGADDALGLPLTGEDVAPGPIRGEPLERAVERPPIDEVRRGDTPARGMF